MLIERLLQEIFEMYEKELASKALILEHVFECRQHETMIIYIAAWQMESNIDTYKIDHAISILSTDNEAP